MWRKIRWLIAILSISLNIAFIAVWCARTMHCSHQVCESSSNKKCDECKGSCPLYRELNLTEDQQHAIEPMQKKYCDSSQSICREVTDLRAELIDLLARPDVPRDSIRLKQEQIIETQRKMQDLTVEHLLAEKKLLSATQSDKLFKIMARGEGCRGQGSLAGLGKGTGSCNKNQMDNK
jgi:hypothetical protein